MFFDTHTHVNFSAFAKDAEEILNRAQKDTWLINVGTQLDTSTQAVEIAKRFETGVYAAIGLHPIHTYQQTVDEEETHFKTREEHFKSEAYEQLLTEKVVAVGECGLDYFRLPPDNKESAKVKQKQSFVSQLNFASKHGLPVIIHCRDAYEDLAEVIKSEYQGLGVIHSYTGDWAAAKKFLDLGFYVAFNGILTFDKTGRLAEVVRNMPSDKILSETDAPYLTPPPFRGKRNEPSYVRYVVEKIAEIRGVDPAAAEELTFNNACKLFNIKQ
ncbi:MAG TPA: TatD family hydrolase [Verrucomicrobiae bacterium]|nr:TatD family hydrolase [Verrucomicrobiae bacterium]